MSKLKRLLVSTATASFVALMMSFDAPATMSVLGVVACSAFGFVLIFAIVYVVSDAFW